MCRVRTLVEFKKKNIFCGSCLRSLIHVYRFVLGSHSVSFILRNQVHSCISARRFRIWISLLLYICRDEKFQVDVRKHATWAIATSQCDRATSFGWGDIFFRKACRQDVFRSLPNTARVWRMGWKTRIVEWSFFYISRAKNVLMSCVVYYIFQYGI